MLKKYIDSYELPVRPDVNPNEMCIAVARYVLKLFLLKKEKETNFFVRPRHSNLFSKHIIR